MTMSCIMQFVTHFIGKYDNEEKSRVIKGNPEH